MKALLYAGAVLMTGAIIYGFVDYNRARHSQGFTNLYKTETPAATKNPTAPANTFDVKESKSASETNVDAHSDKANLNQGAFSPLPSKTVKKKKSITYKSFSSARIVEVPETEARPVTKTRQ